MNLVDLNLGKSGRSLTLWQGKTGLLRGLLGRQLGVERTLEYCSSFLIPPLKEYSVDCHLKLSAVNLGPNLNCSKINIATVILVVLNFNYKLMKLLVA